jgi:iron(II)-dependent oxidoreductase
VVSAHGRDLTAPYFIARFPVTVAQWREYVQRGGITLEDENSLNGRGNDPVVNASWSDAMRFCEFLTLAWREQLPEGFVVTLPSEAEWEKAARGGATIPGDIGYVALHRLGEKLEPVEWIPNPLPQRVYPWGDPFDEDKANVESNIGETSATGCYPLGCSPYGCEDMSGNVWEWTRSSYDRENPDEDGSVGKFVRGGSWLNHRSLSRCAYRLRYHPDARHDLLGFRVVLRSAPVV